MNRYLIPAVVVCFFATPIQISLAQQACPTGGRVTQKCIDTIELGQQDASNLLACFQELHDEYLGTTGSVPGKGPAYLAKKAECVKIAELALGQITMASKPSGDTSRQRTLRQAITNWKK